MRALTPLKRSWELTTGLTVNIILSVCSLAIMLITARAYVTAKDNHSAALYWGSSFFLNTIIYAVYLYAELKGYYSFKYSLALHLLETFAYMSQFKVAVQLFFSSRDFSQKLKRSVKLAYSVILPILFIHFVTFLGEGHYSVSSCGFMGLQTVGFKGLDVYFETFQSVLSMGVCLLLPFRSYFVNLKIGFGLLALSDIIQIVNIVKFNYGNAVLQQVEWAMITTATIMSVIGIVHLYHPLSKFFKIKSEKLIDE